MDIDWAKIQNDSDCPSEFSTQGTGDNIIHTAGFYLMFVDMADNEILVRMDMIFAMLMIISACHKPELPTTYPRRMKKMIPIMVRKLGVNTPANVPILPDITDFSCGAEGGI